MHSENGGTPECNGPHYALCTMRYALEKRGGVWYNISMSENQVNNDNTSVKAVCSQSNLAAGHDNAWKEIINEKYLSPFLEFYFPEFHQDIDFSKGAKLLNTELPQLEPDDQIGDKRAMCLWKCI